jgi:ABC-2 type transport system ATP-binding protein
MIYIENLSKRYGEKIVLDNLSMRIKKGVIFGLLGPNGAGKTTLVSILNGLSDFQKGEVTIFGLSLRDHIRTIRQHSSLIPQKLAFYENLTVMENLHFFTGIQKIKGNKSRDAIDYAVQTGRLKPILNQKSYTLSGGEKRRLNLAIGLLNNPDILFFDEPTVGIDPEARNEILETIHSFKEQNKTVIYTSHYMQEIEKICDEVAIINHGKIVAQGILGEMLQGKGASSVVFEIDEIPMARLQLIAEKLDGLTPASGTSLLFVSRKSNRISSVLQLLETEGVAIREIHYSATSLESLFIHLTSEEGE